MSPFHYPCLGGVDRIRTDDLLHAKQALFQLSYDPFLLLIFSLLLKVVKPVFWKFTLCLCPGDFPSTLIQLLSH